jgi:hypothetical protein
MALGAFLARTNRSTGRLPKDSIPVMIEDQGWRDPGFSHTIEQSRISLRSIRATLAHDWVCA